MAASVSLRKLPKPGGIDQVDLVLVPLGVREARSKGVLAGHFLFIEVRHRRPVIHPAEPVDHPRVEQDGGGELGLARAGMAGDRDIPDTGGVVDLHRRQSSCPARMARSPWDRSRLGA